jgi:hypothetical protein
MIGCGDGKGEFIIPLNQIERHLGNWVYKEARELTEEVRREQIMKGAAKYPVPLGDADWTPLQLVNHAMQENVDQVHYLTMLKFEIEQLNAKIERLEKENARLEKLLNPADET